MKPQSLSNEIIFSPRGFTINLGSLMNIMSYLKHTFFAQKSVRSKLNKRCQVQKQSQPLTSRLLTAVRPLFLISGPTVCEGALLENMTTILSTTSPATTTPVISDSLNILPTELAHYPFSVYHTSKEEFLYSETAQNIIKEITEYKADIIYCDMNHTSPFVEYLLRMLNPELIIAVGDALPEELVTIRLAQREQTLTSIFPFLNNQQ